MADDTDSWNDGSPWLFFLGLVVFLGSGLLFIADLIRGVDVLRSLVGNAAGVALLIAWAAHDTLHNPDSEVANARGATGTALLLYGLYLFAAGIIIAVTGLVHDRLTLGFWYLGLALLSVIAGGQIFPTDSVADEQDATGESGDDSDTAVEETGDTDEAAENTEEATENTDETGGGVTAEKQTGGEQIAGENSLDDTS